MTTYTSTTQNQRDLMAAVALCAAYGPDEALAYLIENGLLDAGHHIESAAYAEAVNEVAR